MLTKAAAALVACLLLAAPARAEDVARVEPPDSIGSLLAGPDGGAWVVIQRSGGWAVGRANADGRFRTTAIDGEFGDGAVGADGAAYFTDDGTKLARVDAAGAVTRHAAVKRSSDLLGFALAAGPDGRLWTTTVQGSRLARITPAGVATFAPLKLPACEFALLVPAMARAGDGTVWIADTGCSRLIHLSADGTPTVIDLPDQLPKSVAGDAAGGAWFSDRTDAIGGHVDGAGHVTYVRHGDDHGAGVAVAPDGAAWFALGRCRLARVAPDGSLTLEPSPLPATSIAFDPSGGLWLASETRLVHSSVGALGTGTCDDTPPQIELPRAGRVSLGALRRGLRVAVREPAYVTALLSLEHGSRHAVLPQRERQFTRAGSVRLHVGAKQLRRLFRGRHPTVTLTVTAEDRDGNQAAREVTLHVVR